MEFSVCLPAVLNKYGVNEAFDAVKAAGFHQYEIWCWWDQDMEAYREAQQKAQLEIVGMCTRMVSLTDPALREEYVQGLKETVPVCHKMGCKMVISQVGAERKGVSREAQHESIVEGLRACLPILRENDLTLVIEPLNTRIDHAGYYLWSAEEAFQIMEEVGDPHVKVLYDLYHQYVMDDLDVALLVKNIDKIGHFHMAGYPGRHEPMRDSEVDYPMILDAIARSGYKGSVGLEYIPVYDAREGLDELRKQLNTIFV